jgi:hypothetical protein
MEEKLVLALHRDFLILLGSIRSGRMRLTERLSVQRSKSRTLLSHFKKASKISAATMQEFMVLPPGRAVDVPEPEHCL